MNFYRPQTKFGKGNVFTSVCHSVHRGRIHPPTPGRHPLPKADTPFPRQTPPSQGRRPLPKADIPFLRQTPPRQKPPGQTPP